MVWANWSILPTKGMRLASALLKMKGISVQRMAMASMKLECGATTKACQNNYFWRAILCSLMKTIMSIAKILLDFPFIKMRFLFYLPRTGATSLVTCWPEIWMEWKPSERTHIWPRKQHTFWNKKMSDFLNKLAFEDLPKCKVSTHRKGKG